MKLFRFLVLSVCLVVSLALVSASSAGDKTCKLKKPCAHHGTTYRIQKVKVSKSIGSGFLKETTAGVFVIVTMKMTNTKSRPSTILSPNLVLKARNGDKYDVTSKALGIKKALLLTKELQPKLPEVVVLVYEIPKSVRRGAILEINDLGSGDKAKIWLRI